MNEIRRTQRELTTDERERLRQIRQQIAEELPELIEQDRQLRRAAEEHSFSGELRQAIHHSGTLLPDVAKQSGISMDELHEFLLGERSLTSIEIDRLIVVLGLTLRSVAHAETGQQ